MATDPFDPRAFRELGHRLVDAMADHLAETSQRSGKTLALQQPQAMLDSVAPLDGTGGQDLFALMSRMLSASNRLHDPRYMGHQVAVPRPELALLEGLNALLNNGMAVYEMGPIQTAMELRALQWMANKLGMPTRTDGVMTSGGSLGNLTALLAARQRAADAWNDGGDRFCVLVSSQAHYCIDRAARILGWGEGGVVSVPVDDAFRMRTDLLPEALASSRRAGRIPVAVVASACSTATGSFDPIDEIATFCEREALWLHVDGAHGAAYALSKQMRPLLAGIERADSVVFDAHKMLQTPALVTGVLFADPAACASVFTQQASYLFSKKAEDEWHNRGHRTIECTKRAMGALLYAAVATLGEARLREDLERGLSLARAFAKRVAEANDFELAVEPQCNIVCFRHRPKGLEGAALDAHNRRVRQALLDDGSFYVVQTALPKGHFLRTTLMNPRTTEADLDAMLDAVRRAARS
jgi:L-2,4-diaminobutyrate decarboxylase